MKTLLMYAVPLLFLPVIVAGLVSIFFRLGYHDALQRLERLTDRILEE